jgi:uncharacterized integral membrane protein
MNWLFLIMCLILAAIIGYLLFAMINSNGKAEYYKKLDRWRKNKHLERKCWQRG